MKVIHFTSAAADPLESFSSADASFLPLADGNGNSHISGLHLERNATVSSPSLTHAAALLVVHGRMTVETPNPQIRIEIHAGSGCIVEKDEAYSLELEGGHTPHRRIRRTHCPRACDINASGNCRR